MPVGHSDDVPLAAGVARGIESAVGVRTRIQSPATADNRVVLVMCSMGTARSSGPGQVNTMAY
jgi:hypothetical protein